MASFRRIIPVFGRFLVVGASGTLVNLATLWALVNAGVPHLLASLLATEVSIITNFILNDNWTFKRQGELSVLARFIRFQLVTSVTAVLTLGLFALFYNTLHLYYLLAQFLAIGIVTVLNFSVNSKLTWGTLTPERLPVPLSEVHQSTDIRKMRDYPPNY